MRRQTQWRPLSLIILGLLAACGGGSNGDGAPDPVDPGGGGGSPPTYLVTLSPMSGAETNLRAVLWVGPRAVSRTEAANPSTLRTSGFSDNTLESGGAGGSLARTVSAQRGQTVTIIAIESEGIYNTTQFSTPPAPQNNVVEFVSFTGATSAQPEPGLATFVAGDANVDVTVNYRRMPQVAVSMIGVGRVHWDFDLPPVREIPARPNSNDRSFFGPSVIFAPTQLVYATLQFHSGSTVTITPEPSGQLLRWEGACSGGGGTCTLTFGAQSGAQNQGTTLVTGYMACTPGGSPVYSGYTPGAMVPAGCSIVLP